MSSTHNKCHIFRSVVFPVLATLLVVGGCDKRLISPDSVESEDEGTCSVTLNISTTLPQSKADWSDMGTGAAGGYAMTDLHVFILHEKGNDAKDTTFVAYKGMKFTNLPDSYSESQTMTATIRFDDIPRGTHLFYIVANTESIPYFWTTRNDVTEIDLTGETPKTKENQYDSIPAGFLKYFVSGSSGETAPLSNIIKLVKKKTSADTTYANGTQIEYTEYNLGKDLEDAKNYIGKIVVAGSGNNSGLTTLTLESDHILLTQTAERRSNHYRNSKHKFDFGDGNGEVDVPAWGQPLSAIVEYTPTEGSEVNTLDVKLVRTGAKISTSINNMTSSDIRLDELTISGLDAGNGYVFDRFENNGRYGIPEFDTEDANGNTVKALGDISSTPGYTIKAISAKNDTGNQYSSFGLILYESGYWTETDSKTAPTLKVRFTLNPDDKSNRKHYIYFFGKKPSGAAETEEVTDTDTVTDASGNQTTTTTTTEVKINYTDKALTFVDSEDGQSYELTELRRNTYLSFNIDIYKGDTPVACHFSITGWENESGITHTFE